MTTSEHAQEAHKEHPSEGLYLSIFVVLALLTLTELLVAYLPIASLKALILLILAATKAVLVAQFYMHLRYESRLFTWVILLPVIVGAVAIVLLQLFIK